MKIKNILCITINKTTNYIVFIVTAIAFLFAGNLQAQQYPAEEGYAFEDDLYLYKWVTPEYPPLPDVRIGGEFFTWEEVYGPLPQKYPILVRNAKYPKIKTVVELPTKSVAPKAATINQSYNQTIKKLHDRVDYFIKNEKESRERLFSLAEEKGIPIIIEGCNGRNSTLVDITEGGEPIYVSSFNVRGVSTIGANKLWPTNLITTLPIATGQSGLNLDGSAQILGMWDPEGYAQTNHPQFTVEGGSSRVIMVNPPETNLVISPHATSVAGVMASAGINDYYYNINLGNYSRGICYNATVHTYSLSSGFTSSFSEEAANGLKLSNNSYGIDAGWTTRGTNWVWLGSTNSTALEDWKFGAYMDSSDSSWIVPYKLDQNSTNAPHTLMVFASGNYAGYGPGTNVTYYYPDNTNLQEYTNRDWIDGDDGNYDTLSSSGCAKNVLTVGGIYSIAPEYTSSNEVVIAPFSSFGPTDDGRIKPEVVAAATCSSTVNNYNPYGFGGLTVLDIKNTSLDVGYVMDTGTSYAAPAVTAGLGLVMQRRNQLRPEWSTNDYPIRSSTLRALAVHTANAATSNQGPSFKFGYGVFDAAKAVDLMAGDAMVETKPYIKEVFLPEGKEVQFCVRAIQSNTPIKVSIAWNDPPGTPQTEGAIDDSTKRLVNDLDLRIYSPGVSNYIPDASTTFKPFILNPDLTLKRASVRGAAATVGDDDVNNLEQIFVNTPSTNGLYTVRVTHKNTTLTGSSQWVSIIVSGVQISEEDFEITNLYRLNSQYVEIEWKAVVGGIYILQSSTTADGPWLNETSEAGISAYQELMTVQIPASGNKKFFRMKRLY